ncbi:MAG TPA: 2-oxoacid:acceptor oxidoreductase subunit alpha, partial [Clostridia bacterium]
ILGDKELVSDSKSLIKLPFKGAAKEAGNVKALGSAAIGALLKLIGLELSHTEGVVSEIFHNEAIATQNFEAIKKGYELTSKKYSTKAPGIDGRILINGNEAIALGALASGCKFYSAYPMTPSTSIMNYLATKIHEAEIVVEQAEDEIAAINMAIGASYAGVRSMTGTSGGGFSLMVEAVGLSGMMEIPLVIAEIQRPGPVTGLPTRTEQSDLKFVISCSQGEVPRMVIALKTPEDAFYQTARAFDLAYKYQIPVILLGDQFLADYTTAIKPFDFDKVKIENYYKNDDYINNEYIRYSITEDGISPMIIPGKTPGRTVLVDSDEHDETGHITESSEVRIRMADKRLRKLETLRNDILEPEFIGADSFHILLVAWGSTYGPVREAVEVLNKNGDTKYAALVFGDIWPLPTRTLLEKASPGIKIINIEQNATGQLASIITECTGIKCSKSILKYDGRQLSGDEIVEKLKELNKEGYHG